MFDLVLNSLLGAEVIGSYKTCVATDNLMKICWWKHVDTEISIAYLATK